MHIASVALIQLQIQLTAWTELTARKNAKYFSTWNKIMQKSIKKSIYTTPKCKQKQFSIIVQLC